MDGAAVYTLATKAGFASHEAAIATQIAWAESGWEPSATNKNTNGTTDYGLMQINSSHASEFDMSKWADPAANMAMAHKVFKAQGWKAWATYNNGKYKSVRIDANPYTGQIAFEPPGGKQSGLIQPTGAGDPSPITSLKADVGSQISGAVNAVTGQISKVAGQSFVVILAIALLVLGVVIVMRREVMGVAKVATPIGRAATIASKAVGK